MQKITVRTHTLSLSLSLSLLFLIFSITIDAQTKFSANNAQLKHSEMEDLGQKYGGHNYEAFNLDLTSLNETVKKQVSTGKVNFTLELGDKYGWELELSENEHIILPEKSKFRNIAFKGTANNNPSNLVLLSITDGSISGFVTDGDKRISIHTEFSPNLIKRSNGCLITVHEQEYDSSSIPINKKTGTEVFLELELHIDHSMFNYFNGDETAMVGEALSLVGSAVIFFTEQTDFLLSVIIRGTVDGDPVIWDTPDNFGYPEIVALRAIINNDWLLHRPCIPVDAAFVLTSKNWPASGRTSGSVCNFDDYFPVAYMDEFTGYNQYFGFVFAHEMGHLFGAKHTEGKDSDGDGEPDPGTNCVGQEYLCEDLPCPTANNSCLMCAQGTCPQEISRAFLDICAKDVINTRFDSNCADCLSDPGTLPAACALCMETAMIEADNNLLVANCNSNNTINYEVTVCNSCDAQDLKVEVLYNTNLVSLQPAPAHNFQSVVNPGGGSPNRVLTSTLNFDGEECKTFFFAFDAKTGVSGTITSAVEVNGIELDQVKVSSIGEVIGQSGQPTSLNSLITNSTLPGFGAACSNQTSTVKQFQIEGTLEIDVPYCMNNFDLFMRPGSKILVKDNISLETKGGTHLFACDQMWQGIHLEEGASITMSNSTIEDAQYAIKATGNSILDITGSNFNNNFIGIYVENPYGGAGYVGNTTFTALSGNTFDGGGGLLAPYAGQGGGPVGTVGSEAFAGIWIDNPSLMVHAMGNTFQNMSNGIYARNTSLKVTGCTFANIQENSYPSFMSGYGIRAAERRGTKTFQQSGFGSGAGSPASFKNCSKGIYVVGMKVDYIKDNFMRVDRGIELVRTQHKGRVAGNSIVLYKNNNLGIAVSHPSPTAEIEVVGNDVTLNATATNSTAIQYNAMGLELMGGGKVALNTNDIVLGAANNIGIHTTSSNSALLQQNNVTLQADATNGLAYRINNDYNSLLNCNDATGIDGADGIGFDVWDAESTKYHCNDFSNMTTGVYFQMGSPSANNFKENEFSGGDVGLRISGSAAIGGQVHKGNRWTGGFGNVAAKHEGGQSDLLSSEFKVNELPGSPFHPILPGQEIWFDYDDSGTPDNDCSGWVTCVVDAENPNGDGLFLLDGSIVNGNFQVNEYPMEIGWLAKRYTFRKLAKDPSLAAPGSIYETFYNNESSSTVGKFVDINLNTSNMFQIDSATQSLIDGEHATIHSSMDSIANIDIQLLDGQDSLLVQQRATELQNVKNAESNLETLIDLIIAQQVTDADGIISQNTAVATSLIFETNKKTVNDIYLNTVAKGIIEFTQSQLTDIQSIAFQCPFTGGSAVYEARSLLTLEMDTLYDDNLLCASAQGLRRNDNLTTIDHEGFHLYPNPAKDQVTLLLPDDIVKGKVVLINAQGAIVTTMRIEAKSRSAIINTNQLVEGIYLLNVFDNNRKVYSEKLIIVH